MPKFVIEREIPGAGNLTDAELREISRKSVAVLKGMGTEIQWLQSYVTGDKVYCIYLAPDEATIREHARRGGFPANRVSAVRGGARLGRTLLRQRGVVRQQLNPQDFGFSTSETAASNGITQPSSHAARAAAVDNFVRAGSRCLSSLFCSATVSGAPIDCRNAAATPASRSALSTSARAAATAANDSSARAIPRLCPSS